MSRTRLLQLAAQLDRLLAEADSILAAPVYADIGVLAEELREVVVDLQAKVDEKLDLPHMPLPPNAVQWE